MSAKPAGPLAIALRYDKPRAPVVVAKGEGELGQAIIDVARQHGVPLRQDPGLAQALSQVELESEIPPELYRAVAAVIGFILRASKPAKPRAGARPVDVGKRPLHR